MQQVKMHDASEHFKRPQVHDVLSFAKIFKLDEFCEEGEGRLGFIK